MALRGFPQVRSCDAGFEGRLGGVEGRLGRVEVTLEAMRADQMTGLAAITGMLTTLIERDADRG